MILLCYIDGNYTKVFNVHQITSIRANDSGYTGKYGLDIRLGGDSDSYYFDTPELRTNAINALLDVMNNPEAYSSPVAIWSADPLPPP